MCRWEGPSADVCEAGGGGPVRVHGRRGDKSEPKTFRLNLQRRTRDDVKGALCKERYNSTKRTEKRIPLRPQGFQLFA